MKNIADTLLFAIGYLNFTVPPQGEVLMIGGYSPLFSKHFPKAHFICPYAGQISQWTAAGHKPYLHKSKPDLILLASPQQSKEADFAIATALSLAKETTLVMAVADNQTGGKTLPKRMENFGCQIQDMSKHKCRAVWTRNATTANQEKIAKALETGGIQQRVSDGLFTQAGIFSWERRDIGTEILLKHLPSGITGKGADFGCGLGEISRVLLQQNPEIKTLLCIDHDQRAIDCCSKNLSAFAEKVDCLCQDIPKETTHNELDFIVMNPPFHTGKEENKDLGKAFITKAASSLKPKGKLYMVANAHLPYDTLLQSLFPTVTLLAKENGFKVFEASKYSHSN